MRQHLPADQSATVRALLRQLDFMGGELALVDRELAIEALTDPVVARLMTIPGVDAIAGSALSPRSGTSPASTMRTSWSPTWG
jgi:transposase